MHFTLKKVLRIGLVLVIAGMAIYYFYPEDKLPATITIDKIVIYKSKQQFLVYSNGQLIKTYTVSIGGNPVGPKQFEGDRKTPEGLYTVSTKNPHSHFHKGLAVSYPNKTDRLVALAHGKSPGGEVEIHGMRNGLGFIGKFQRWFNWTAGCIALTDKEIDELYDHIPVGTKIEIKP